MGSKKPKPYNEGTMTEAAFRSHIISGLRKASMYWKPKGVALKESRDGKMIHPETGRERIVCKCSHCGKRDFENKMKVDHIDPVVPVDGFNDNLFLNINWSEYIERMFVEVDGYQVLCKECHDLKTKKETDERKRSNSIKTQSK